MPTVAIAAIAYAGGYITAGQALFTAASFAISTAMSNRANKKAEEAQRNAADAQRAAFNAGLADRTQVVRTGVQPRNIILGRDEASGPLLCWFTYGPLRNFHAFAVVIAGHECDAIETVMFNHEPVTLDDSGAVIAPAKYVRTTSSTYTERFPGGPAGTTHVLSRTPTQVDSVLDAGRWPMPYSISGNVITQLADSSTYIDYEGNMTLVENCVVSFTVTTHEPLFRVKKYLGAPGQAAAPELMAGAAAAGIPASWDASRKGTGITYLSVVMEADFNLLGQIGVPNVSGLTRGVKAYDPRTGITAWTQNSAVLARWFIVDSGFSPKTLSTEVHAGELLASANVCDEAVAFSASRLEARYTCNGQLTSAASPIDNRDHILESMDGDTACISGQWQIVAGYYKTPTLDLDEDTLSSAGITIAPYTAKRDLFNGVKGTFVNAAAGYVRMGYDMVTSEVYQAQDGGELLPSEVNFELVNDPIRCQMIAWQRLTRARQPLTMQLGTTLRGYDSAPLQTINVSLRRPGYTNKPFLNLRREFDKNTLIYVLQETGPEVWAWDYTRANAAVDIPKTSYPDVTSIPLLTGVTVYSGTDALQMLGDGTIISRGRLRWTAVTNTFVSNGGKIEWQHKNAALVANDWTALPAARGEDVEIFTGALVDGDFMLARGRCVTALGRKGDWCPVVSFQVIGKTERPPDVVSFTVMGQTFTWTPVVALDLAGYEVRFNYGQNRAWGTGTPLHTGLITESPWSPLMFPPGAITVMIKSIDTSGNESANAASILTNLGDVIVDNLIEVYDDKAAGFPGSAINGTVSGGDMLADDSGDLFWGQDNGNFWGQDGARFWPDSTYLQMVYATAYTVTADQVGARLTLLTEIEGESYSIEYRFDTQGTFWGLDDAFFWGADAAPFWVQPTEWQTWPGAIENMTAGRLELRITTQAGPSQGAIRELTLQFDVEDELEIVNDVHIGLAGTRLPLTKSFRSIKNVQLTMQSDGGTATYAEIADKLSTGPLIICKNPSGLTTGLIDALVQGVKGH